MIGANGVHHVGIAVADLDAAIEHYTSTVGGRLEFRRELPDQGIEGAVVMVGDDEIELIAPLGDNSTVARFLERRGPGLHHVAYAVDDVEASLRQLEAAGTRLIDQHPRIGLHGVPIAFVHPSAAFGVLVELVEASH